jgi:MbtH protein
MNEREDDGRLYIVIVNDEEQYSIWPGARSIPAGWRIVATQARRTACLEYIEKVWTDMRPLSLQKRIKEQLGAIRRS